MKHVFSSCSCSCRGTETWWENVWGNKTTSTEEKTLLHNSVAPECMPMLRRSETQFREEVVFSLVRITASSPALGRLQKASPAVPLGTWRGMATLSAESAHRPPTSILEQSPQQLKELQLSCYFPKPLSSASALHTLSLSFQILMPVFHQVLSRVNDFSPALDALGRKAGSSKIKIWQKVVALSSQLPTDWLSLQPGHSEASGKEQKILDPKPLSNKIWGIFNLCCFSESSRNHTR